MAILNHIIISRKISTRRSSKPRCKRRLHSERRTQHDINSNSNGHGVKREGTDDPAKKQSTEIRRCKEIQYSHPSLAVLGDQEPHTDKLLHSTSKIEEIDREFLDMRIHTPVDTDQTCCRETVVVREPNNQRGFPKMLWTKVWSS
jgi:hypothetical protein